MHRAKIGDDAGDGELLIDLGSGLVHGVGQNAPESAALVVSWAKGQHPPKQLLVGLVADQLLDKLLERVFGCGTGLAGRSTSVSAAFIAFCRKTCRPQISCLPTGPMATRRRYRMWTAARGSRSADRPGSVAGGEVAPDQVTGGDDGQSWSALRLLSR